MKRFMDLVNDCCSTVSELMPWDLEEKLASNPSTLVVDVREPYEFSAMHIEGSLNVPRGIIESASEWDYEETVPELVQARDRDVVLVCRSGNRSLLAGANLRLLGYQKVFSLKTGLRGWKDFEQPLIDAAGNPVDLDAADDYFMPRLRPEQHRPA